MNRSVRIVGHSKTGHKRNLRSAGGPEARVGIGKPPCSLSPSGMAGGWGERDRFGGGTGWALVLHW
jgi:hypothetical protein